MPLWPILLAIGTCVLHGVQSSTSNNVSQLDSIEHHDHQKDNADMLAQSMLPDTLNQRFPIADANARFEVTNLLGVGGMGIVYQVLDRTTGEVLAAKLTSKAYMAYHKRGKVLAREVEFMRQVGHHPNFVGLQGVTHTAEHVVFLMDLVPGSTLYNYQLGEWNEDQLQALAAQCLSALAFLDSMGIVHRDIKMENIMVDFDGRVQICDFGLAVWGSAQASTAGTFPSWPPELLAPQEYLTTDTESGEGVPVGWTHKADVWSLANIIFCIQSKRRPFPCDEDALSKFNDREDKIKIVRDATLKRPLKFCGTMPDGCRSFMRQALEKDPTKRPSAVELLKHPWLKDVDAEQPVIVPSREMPPETLVQSKRDEQEFFEMASKLKASVGVEAMESATEEFACELLRLTGISLPEQVVLGQ